MPLLVGLRARFFEMVPPVGIAPTLSPLREEYLATIQSRRILKIVGWKCRPTSFASIAASDLSLRVHLRCSYLAASAAARFLYERSTLLPFSHGGFGNWYPRLDLHQQPPASEAGASSSWATRAFFDLKLVTTTGLISLWSIHATCLRFSSVASRRVAFAPALDTLTAPPVPPFG